MVFSSCFLSASFCSDSLDATEVQIKAVGKKRFPALVEVSGVGFSAGGGSGLVLFFPET